MRDTGLSLSTNEYQLEITIFILNNISGVYCPISIFYWLQVCLGSQWKIHMPAALMYNLCDDKYNWYYNTEPQENLNNRRVYWPRGRVWGGSSSLNAMVYIRSGN